MNYNVLDLINEFENSDILTIGGFLSSKNIPNGGSLNDKIKRAGLTDRFKSIKIKKEEIQEKLRIDECHRRLTLFKEYPGTYEKFLEEIGMSIKGFKFGIIKYGFSKEFSEIVSAKKKTLEHYMSCKRTSTTLNHTFFEKIDTEDKAYWLGFISADGNVGKNNNRISITQNVDEKYHLEKFLKSVNAEDARFEFKAETNTYRVAVYSKKMHSDLGNLGIIPNKSLVLEPYSDIDIDLLNHYIRGLIDGDGWISLKGENSHRTIEVGFCGTKSMCEMIRDISIHLLDMGNTNSVGINSSLRENILYRIRFQSKNKIKIFLDWLYADANIFLVRKHENYLKFISEFKIS